jgi:hypothetical protein
MPKVPNLFVPSEQLRPVQMPAMQAPGVQPYVETQSQQIEKLGAGMERLGQGAMSFSGDMRAVERLQGQEQERKAAIAAQRQDRVDDARSKEADNRISEILRVASTEQTKRVGKAAVDAWPEVSKDVDKKIKELIDGLDSDTQRQQVKYIADRRLQQFKEQNDKHTIEQERVYNMGETATRINNNMLDAAQDITGYDVEPDPKSYNVPTAGYRLYKNTMEQESEALSDYKGYPKDSEQRKQDLLEAQNKLHTMVLAQLLEKRDATGAKKYLEYWEAKKEIDPVVSKKVLAELKSTEIANESMRLGIEWAAMPGTAYEKDQNLRDLVRQGKMSADVYKTTSAYLYDDESKRDKALASMENNDIAWAQEFLTLPENRDKSVDLLRMVDPVRFSRMQLTGSIEKIREWDRGNKRQITDPQWQDILLKLKVAETPTEYKYKNSQNQPQSIILKPLRDMSEEEYQAAFKWRLSNSDYKDGLSALRDSKGIPEEEKETRNRLFNLRLNQHLVAMGLKKTSTDADGFSYVDATSAAQAHGIEEKALLLRNELEKKLKREPTLQEIETEVFKSSLLNEKATIERPWWFDKPDQYVVGLDKEKNLKIIIPGKDLIDYQDHKMEEIPGYADYVEGQVPESTSTNSFLNIKKQLERDGFAPTYRNIMNEWINAGKPNKYLLKAK